MDLYREIIKKYGTFFDSLESDLSFECFTILRVFNNQFTYINTNGNDILIKEGNTEYVCSINFNNEDFYFKILPQQATKESIKELKTVRKYLKYDSKTKVLTIEEIDHLDYNVYTQVINLSLHRNPFYTNHIQVYSLEDLANLEKNLLSNGEVLSNLYQFNAPLFNENPLIKPTSAKEISISKYKGQAIKIKYLLPLKNEEERLDTSGQYSSYLKGANFITSGFDNAQKKYKK